MPRTDFASSSRGRLHLTVTSGHDVIAGGLSVPISPAAGFACFGSSESSTTRELSGATPQSCARLASALSKSAAFSGVSNRCGGAIGFKDGCNPRLTDDNRLPANGISRSAGRHVLRVTPISVFHFPLSPNRESLLRKACPTKRLLIHGMIARVYGS
jgi:hypothetical protein